MCEKKQAVKSILIFFVVYIVVWGISLIAVGGWAMDEECKPTFVRLNAMDSGLYMITEGLVAILVAGFGVYAVCSESVRFLVAYVVLLVLLMVTALLHVVYLVTTTPNVERTIVKGLSEVMEGNELTFREIQKNYQCCGVKNFRDYSGSDLSMILHWTCCAYSHLTCTGHVAYDFGCALKLTMRKRYDLNVAVGAMSLPVMLILLSMPFLVYLIKFSIKRVNVGCDCE